MTTKRKTTKRPTNDEFAAPADWDRADRTTSLERPFKRSPSASERPRTVCADCEHVHDTYESYDKRLSYECTATPLWWSPVTGVPTWAMCADVNDGECPKWEARPAQEPEPPVLDEPPVGAVGPILSLDELSWWIGGVLAAALIVAGVGVYVWFVSQNGWRWW